MSISGQTENTIVRDSDNGGVIPLLCFVYANVKKDVGDDISFIMDNVLIGVSDIVTAGFIFSHSTLDKNKHSVKQM